MYVKCIETNLNSSQFNVAFESASYLYSIVSAFYIVLAYTLCCPLLNNLFRVLYYIYVYVYVYSSNIGFLKIPYLKMHKMKS